MNMLIHIQALLSGPPRVLYTGLMSQSFAARLLSSRLIRNLLAIAGTLTLTFFVFRGVAAFNDVLKMYNSLPVEQPYSCEKGYALVKNKAGKQECIPAPSSTKGVVSVGISAPSSAKKPATQP